MELDGHLPDLSRGAESDPQVTVRMPPEMFGGVWANAVQVARTPDEITLDFVRVGPGGQNAMVVSRVNVGARLAVDLCAHLGGVLADYQENGKPE